MRALTTASTNLRRILLTAKAAGVATDGALAAEHMKALDDPDARVPWEVVRDLWLELEKRSGGRLRPVSYGFKPGLDL